MDIEPSTDLHELKFKGINLFDSTVLLDYLFSVSQSLNLLSLKRDK